MRKTERITGLGNLNVVEIPPDLFDQVDFAKKSDEWGLGFEATLEEIFTSIYCEYVIGFYENPVDDSFMLLARGQFDEQNPDDPLRIQLQDQRDHETDRNADGDDQPQVLGKIFYINPMDIPALYPKLMDPAVDLRSPIVGVELLQQAGSVRRLSVELGKLMLYCEEMGYPFLLTSAFQADPMVMVLMLLAERRLLLLKQENRKNAI